MARDYLFTYKLTVAKHTYLKTSSTYVTCLISSMSLLVTGCVYWQLITLFSFFLIYHIFSLIMFQGHTDAFKGPNCRSSLWAYTCPGLNFSGMFIFRGNAPMPSIGFRPCSLWIYVRNYCAAHMINVVL